MRRSGRRERSISRRGGSCWLCVNKLSATRRCAPLSLTPVSAASAHPLFWQLAHAAYVSSITGHSPSSFAILSALSSSTPLSTLIAREAANLYKLIQRATRLATFELLLPGPEVCLHKQLEEARVGEMARAICLEMQIACLETLLDKTEAQEVLPSLIEALLELYDEERYPIRRARSVDAVPSGRLLVANTLTLQDPRSADATAMHAQLDRTRPLNRRRRRRDRYFVLTRRECPALRPPITSLTVRPVSVSRRRRCPPSLRLSIPRLLPSMARLSRAPSSTPLLQRVHLN